MAKTSSASCSGMAHTTFGAWNVGLRMAPKTPTRRLATPFCSLISVSELRKLRARSGLLIESAVLTNSPSRRHRLVDELNKAIPNLMLILSLNQRIEQTLPLGHRRRWIRDIDFLQEALDLAAGQSIRCISKNSTGCLQVG